MTNGESLDSDDEHVGVAQTTPVASSVVTTAPKDRLRETAVRPVGHDADHSSDRQEQAPLAPARSSSFLNLATTAIVALTCGVLGAMGYAHFSGPKSGETSPRTRQPKPRRTRCRRRAGPREPGRAPN